MYAHIYTYTYNCSLYSSKLRNIGLPKSPYVFFPYNKRHIFNFHNNFIDLDILRMPAISHVVYNTDCSQLMSWFDCYQLQLVTRLWSIVQREISSLKLRKPLLTHSISHSTFSTHCTNLFWHFSCVFAFLEIIKSNMSKMLHIFFYFNIKMATQKFTNFGKFF